MTGGGADAFAEGDGLFEGDEFFVFAVEADGEADVVAGELGDFGAVDGGGFGSGVGFCLEAQVPEGQLDPLAPADDDVHGVGGEG